MTRLGWKTVHCSRLDIGYLIASRKLWLCEVQISTYSLSLDFTTRGRSRQFRLRQLRQLRQLATAATAATLTAATAATATATATAAASFQVVIRRSIVFHKMSTANLYK